MRLLLGVAICWAACPPAFGQANQKAIETTHVEGEPIEVELGPGGKLDTIAMDARGRVLAAVSWPDPRADGRPPTGQAPPRRRGRPRRGRPRPGQRPAGRGFPGETGPRQAAIRVLDAAGRQLASWRLGSRRAKMVHACDDGAVYIGADGRLSLLDAAGRVRKTLDLADTLDGQYAGAHVSGMTANDDHLFVAFGKDFSLRATEDIVRMGRDFSDPKIIVEQQFGCCAHIDLEVQDKELLVAENSRHRVNRFSLDGELIERWGSRDRTGIEGFAACCNPVNIDFGPGGALFTAESGVGRVKRYSAKGDFLGLVGYIDTTKFDRGSRLAAMSCYIPVEVSADGSRVYIMDVRASTIRVLEAKP